jgi:uncharacterized protein (DUF362 family)
MGPKSNHRISRIVTRRSFLAAGLFGLSAATLSPALSLAQTSRPHLGLARGDPGPATESAVRVTGGMEAFVREGDNVLIKPNMSFSSGPDAAVNTHPEVVEALARMCLQSGASRVYIMDHTLRDPSACRRESGIGSVAEKFSGNVEVQTPSGSHRFQQADISRGKQLVSSEFLKEALAADVLIAAPVAKHHGSTGVSLSMKGMMGLILDRGAFHWKYDLNTAIVDLCTRLWADLTVVDATRALTSHGPSGPGNVVRPNTVIASRDMVAADAKAVSMIPWYGQSVSPAKVGHIREAHERGLGRMDVENLSTGTIEA